MTRTIYSVFADHVATTPDVIAIEAALGDANRHMGTGPHPELSGVALNLLRNKRSIVLDLRDEAGYEALLRLVSSADVFVTNLRPGSRARARITRDDLAIARPDLVWCAAAGYPADSERADDAAYDDIIQAAAGLVDVAERSGLPPVLSPTLLVDKVCGMALAQAVTAGLLHRERTGEGSETVLAMYDIIRGFLLVEHGAAMLDTTCTSIRAQMFAVHGGLCASAPVAEATAPS